MASSSLNYRGKQIFARYPEINYILAYKFSQDHIETCFPKFAPNLDSITTQMSISLISTKISTSQDGSNT